jgi:hypothetical protein
MQIINVRGFSSFAAVACLVNFCLLSQASYAQDPYAPLEKILQTEGFVPHFPLSDTIHPGGLAKLCGSSKAYDFIPLAPGAKVADTVPALFQWATTTSDKKMTISLLLNAVGSILSGVKISAGANADHTINLNQISAGGLTLKYDPISVLQADPVLRQEVRNYQSSCSIFLVTEVATTNAISFTTDSAIGASIHVNNPSADSPCVLPPTAVAAAKSAAAPAAAPAAKPAAKPAASPDDKALAAIAAAAEAGLGDPSPTAAKPATTSGDTTVSQAVPLMPSAHLAACMTNADQITLNSPNALTFAVKLEALNKLPPESPAAYADIAQPPPGVGTIDLSQVISPHAAPVKGYKITGMANPTSPDNILKMQYQKANTLPQ